MSNKVFKPVSSASEVPPGSIVATEKLGGLYWDLGIAVKRSAPDKVGIIQEDVYLYSDGTPATIHVCYDCGYAATGHEMLMKACKVDVHHCRRCRKNTITLLKNLDDIRYFFDRKKAGEWDEQD